MSSSRLDRVLGSGLVSWRAVAIAVAAVAFVWSWWLVGPPVTRPDQLLWILIVILIANVGRGLSIPRILIDWLPLFVILYLYDYTRGWTTSLGIPTHYVWALNADKFLFHGTVPTQWLQIHFYDPPVVHWYDTASGLVYLSHFFASLALATGLYIYSRDRWAAFMRRFILLSLAGLTTYVLFPAAPPWLANQRGLLPDVAPITGHGLGALHLAPDGDLADAGPCARELRRGGAVVARRLLDAGGALPHLRGASPVAADLDARLPDRHGPGDRLLRGALRHRRAARVGVRRRGDARLQRVGAAA